MEVRLLVAACCSLYCNPLSCCCLFIPLPFVDNLTRGRFWCNLRLCLGLGHRISAFSVLISLHTYSLHTYHTSIHPCIHPCILASIHAFMHACIHPCIHPSIHASMHACIRTHAGRQGGTHGRTDCTYIYRTPDKQNAAWCRRHCPGLNWVI